MTSLPDHFTTHLPMKRAAADCLIFGSSCGFLVVEPTYKSTWDVPGRVGEVDKSPRDTARREDAEEPGLAAW